MGYQVTFPAGENGEVLSMIRKELKNFVTSSAKASGYNSNLLTNQAYPGISVYVALIFTWKCDLPTAGGSARYPTYIKHSDRVLQSIQIQTSVFSFTSNKNWNLKACLQNLSEWLPNKCRNQSRSDRGFEQVLSYKCSSI